MSADVPELMVLRLYAIRYEGAGINSFEFRPVAGGVLPPFSAGAHVDVHLANGMVRQYSLCNPESETHRFVLGVKREARGRGGSRLLHDEMRVGDTVRISHPRNHFQLVETAAHSILFGGGIGITPLVSMAKRLSNLGRSFKLYYSVRHRSELAFSEALADLNAYIHIDDESQGRPLEFGSVFDAAPLDTHFYCCGPAPMLDAFESAGARLPSDRIHLERFISIHRVDQTGGYTVTLARTGKHIQVHKGQTILQALRCANVDIAASCEQGVCGSCETRVLGGVPDHRDSLLSDEEKASNRVMMVCCSGSKSSELVLDL